MTTKPTKDKSTKRKSTVVFHGCGPERGRKRDLSWIAYWTMENETGKFACHQLLPLNIHQSTQEEAEEYAVGHPDPWVLSFAPMPVKPKNKKKEIPK